MCSPPKENNHVSPYILVGLFDEITLYSLFYQCSENPVLLSGVKSVSRL